MTETVLLGQTLTEFNVCVPSLLHRECMLDILFDRGIDSFGGLLDAAEASGVVERRGSYYYYGSVKLGQVR